MKKTIDKVADEVISLLRDKVIIHRYDSYSTNSVYLKFDWGVANSLRISDHNGKRHLAYRYNIIVNSNSEQKEHMERNGYDMWFYPVNMVQNCVSDILQAKTEKEYKYRDYGLVVEKAKNEAKNQKGFWHNARIIK